MSRACAAFGPKDSYLLSTSLGWRCKDLPQAVLGLFTGPHRAKDIQEIALGPDGNYAVVYIDQVGVRRFLGHSVAQDLEDWVVGPGRDLDTIEIALGPNNAFFAMDSTGAIWDELPDAFDSDIKSLLDPLGGWKYGKNPTSVSFGPNGDYIFITQDGCAGFHLHDDYPAALKKYVVEKQWFGLKNTCVILNPSRLGTYMILNGDGLAEGAFPPNCVVHFQAFAQEWKVIVKNAQIDATNAILERSGSTARLPRERLPSSPTLPAAHSPSSTHPSSPPPYSPYPSYITNPSPGPPGRPLMQGLQQISNAGTNSNSTGAYASTNSSGNYSGGGGGGGLNGTLELFNNLMGASNNLDSGNNNSSGGDSTSVFLNSLVSASNSGNGGYRNADMINAMLNNGAGVGNAGLGTSGFDPTSLLNMGSLFDPTSIITSGLFS